VVIEIRPRAAAKGAAQVFDGLVEGQARLLAQDFAQQRAERAQKWKACHETEQGETWGTLFVESFRPWSPDNQSEHYLTDDNSTASIAPNTFPQGRLQIWREPYLIKVALRSREER
jgi:hypothetical protein